VQCQSDDSDIFFTQTEKNSFTVIILGHRVYWDQLSTM